MARSFLKKSEEGPSIRTIDLFLGLGIIFERAGKLLSFGLQPHSLTIGRVRTEMRIDMPRAAASENKTFQQ